MPQPSRPLELPVVEGFRPVRADAARNRSALLDAAARMLAEQGIDAITMDAVACAAGVGKGTLFRRFGDRTGLLRALIDDRERAFQEAFIRGPAPLGPGAAPCQRLIAFGWALLDLLEEHGVLLSAADPNAGELRYGHPVYLAYRAHMISLLSELVGDGRADYLADVLLAALAPGLVVHQRQMLGLSLGELKDGWRLLLEAVT